MLKLIANRLRANLRYEEATARFGGDEFAVILEIIDAATAERRIAEIAAAVLEPYDIYSPATGTHVKALASPTNVARAGSPMNMTAMSRR